MYRRANIDDCILIFNLICDLECKELSYKRFRAILSKQLLRDDYYGLVCVQDNRIIGFLNLRFEEQLHHVGYVAEIIEFAVDIAYRNRGVGKSMFERACYIAKKYGCLQIEVACNQQRKNTHRFYLREKMHNHHYKFSKSLTTNDSDKNTTGK